MSTKVAAGEVKLKRVYEPQTRCDGVRVLVDRLWPRGVSKTAAALDQWMKEIAPSTELRKWFGHDPERWEEFGRRYAAELHGHAGLFGSRRGAQRCGRAEGCSSGAKADMTAPPPSPAPYRSTPVFDENSLPAGLRREHRTKLGVWGVIRVLEGRVRYEVLDPVSETILEPGHPGLVLPDVPHRVEPLGAMRMQVEFYDQKPDL
jgi:uncharacterized protein YeaO (DUF488 family)/tellurite resistance-related uncharacterized protein